MRWTLCFSSTMYLINHLNRKTLGLLSAALFVMLFLGLYETMTPTPSRPRPRPRPQVTDKLGQASGPGPPGGPETVLHTSGHGHVLAGDLVLHDSPATYPRLARLSDGSVLLGVTRFDPPARVLAVQRSVDDGRTFQPWGEVTRCAGDCDNLFLLEVPAPPEEEKEGEGEGAGEPRPRVLAAFRNHDVADDPARLPTYFRITVCESLDGGRTWAYLSQAAEKPAPNGLWEPFMRLGAGGEVQMAYSQELGPGDQDTVMRASRDGGRTWSGARTATGAGERLRDGMTGIAPAADRGARPALVMVLETTRRPGAFSVEAVVSYDDGETWGHRQPVYAPARPGASAGAPQIGAFAGGGLAAAFMTDEDVDADARDWPRKATVKVVFGGPLLDGKIQWRSPEDACPTPSFWPGVFGLSGSQLMVACEHEEGIRGRILEWAL